MACRLTGLHHVQSGQWHVPLVRLGLGVLVVALVWPGVYTLLIVVAMTVYVSELSVAVARSAQVGSMIARFHEDCARAAAVAQRVVAAGPATLAGVPRRMRKPRFAARIQRLQRAVSHYQAARFAYVAFVLLLVIYASLLVEV
ncbi:hypothetical protein CYMTET_11044 [Cymbomonas tetramitiformis]|uniref:Uncharacterized protein n=1 Tax=Cymbomonas tetramitiformis TaxID=36881 RepID=A0AAE0GPG0_9CHLO|nr:hypothetical protein CYMTET_11044 [Cymbomonas tetramitiformis]